MKKLILLLSVLALSTSVNAKTSHDFIRNAGLGSVYPFLEYTTVTLDTCVFTSDVSFIQESRFQFVPVMECIDFDDPDKIIYRAQWDISITPEKMESMKQEPKYKKGNVWTVKFYFGAKWSNGGIYKVNYGNGRLATLTYRTTLSALEKAEGKKLDTTSAINANTIINGRGMASPLADKWFWYEGGKPITSSGASTGGSVQGGTRVKTIGDIMKGMVGQTRDQMEKTMGKSWEKVTTKDNITELLATAKYGPSNKKSCIQAIYLDSRTNKVIGWFTDCPEGNYGKVPIASALPVPDITYRYKFN